MEKRKGSYRRQSTLSLIAQNLRRAVIYAGFLLVVLIVGFLLIIFQLDQIKMNGLQ